MPQAPTRPAPAAIWASATCCKGMSRSSGRTGASRCSSSIARRKRSPFPKSMTLCGKTSSRCRTKSGAAWWNRCKAGFAGGPKSRDRYSSDPEAYNEFMAGLRESYSDREETLESAVQHLSRAIERDPEFALAHAWLSYVSMHIYSASTRGPPGLEKAEHHCRPGAGSWTRRCRRDIWPGHLFCGARRRISSTPKPSRRWNRFWRRGRILSGPITGWPRFACISGVSRKAPLPTSRRSGRIPRTRANNLEFIYLCSGDFARAEEAGEAWIREKPRNHGKRSGFIRSLR